MQGAVLARGAVHVRGTVQVQGTLLAPWTSDPPAWRAPGVPRARRGGASAGTLDVVPFSRRLLDEDEDVLLSVRPHWVFLAGPLALTVLALAAAVAIDIEFPHAPVAVLWLLVAMVALPVLWLLARTWRWLGVSIVVTDYRLVYRRGLVSRNVTQLRLQRIVEVHLTQSLLERLVGAARVVVEVQGESQPVFIDDVRRPRSLQSVLNRQLDLLESGSVPRPPRTPSAPASSPTPGVVLGSATVPSGVPAVPGSAPWNANAAASPPFLDTTPPRGTVLQAETAAISGVSAPPPPAPHELSPDDPTSASPAGATTATPAAEGSSPAAAASAPPILEQLIQLDELRRRGIVTDAEFAAKKSELLRRL